MALTVNDCCDSSTLTGGCNTYASSNMTATGSYFGNAYSGAYGPFVNY